MPWTFEIESMFYLQSRQKVMVLAKILSGEISGYLTDRSTLGSVQIEKWFDIPRAFDIDGNIRTDLYAFCLVNADDQHKLEVGQVVKLIL